MGYVFDAMARSKQRASEEGRPLDPEPSASRSFSPDQPLGAEAAGPAGESSRAAAESRADSNSAPRAGKHPDRAAAKGEPGDRPGAAGSNVSNDAPFPLERERSKSEPADPFHPVSRRTDLEEVDERLIALTDSGSVASEEYRAIRTGLLARIKHRRHLVHTITSATPQEGKTFTSLNLGLSLAELRNRKSIVVEADLRLPQFQKLFNLPQTPGVVQLLRNEARLDEVVHEIGERGLHVIPAGDRVQDQAVELLSRPDASDLLKALREKYDHVIVDTPPVIELADAGIIGRMSDEVLLIVRMNRTPHPLVEQAINTLSSYDAPVVGMIATDDQRHRRRYYAYRYGYRYGYRYRYGDYRKAA